MSQKVNYDKKRADALRAMHDKRVKEAAEAAKKAKQEAEAANEGEQVNEALNQTVTETVDAEQKAA